MSVGHAQYNMIDYGKHENLLMNKCLLYIYLPPDWVGKYLVTYHNNVTHIYSDIDQDV